MHPLSRWSRDRRRAHCTRHRAELWPYVCWPLTADSPFGTGRRTGDGAQLSSGGTEGTASREACRGGLDKDRRGAIVLVKPVGAIGSHAEEIPTALAMAPGEIGPWCVSNVEDLFIVQATLTAPWISSVPRLAHEGPKLELPGRNP